MMKFVQQVITALLNSEAHKAIKIISDTEVIRATRRLYRGRIQHRRNVEIQLTIGKPNYSERRFIGDCLTAGERLPVRKIVLKYPTKKRA